MKSLNQKLSSFIRTKAFFGLVLAFFIASSVWIALSARFPMAFDEGFHLGIIKIYAHQWSPFLLHQPPGPATYGSLTTDPNCLYYYIMSFPYRLFSSLVTDPKTVIIALRFINIGFFTAALLLMRRVLLKARASSAVVHLTLFFFILIPIVPLLAGQINYDNLVFLILAINLLLVIRFRELLLRKKYNSSLLLNIISFTTLGCLVKYAYLPFLLAITIYLLVIIRQVLGSPAKAWPKFVHDWQGLSQLKKWLTLILLVFSTGIFLQRYGVGIVKYHNIIPQCGQVLNVQRCTAYPIWARNYSLVKHSHNVGFGNPLYFVGGWFYGMFERAFFAINGQNSVANYDNKPPLPLMSLVAISVFGFGLYLVGRYRRVIFKNNPILKFLIFVSIVYVMALVGRNYHDYLQFGGQLVAINGRYLLLIILPIMLSIAMAYKQFVQVKLRLAVIGVVCLLMLQGGSAISYIYYSTPYWYWSNDRRALKMNNTAKSIIKPFILPWPGVK